MNVWDGITKIGLVIGITSLRMIAMELLPLGAEENYILMNDWDGITNIGVYRGITPLRMNAMELLSLGWWQE